MSTGDAKGVMMQGVGEDEGHAMLKVENENRGPKLRGRIRGPKKS